MKAFIPYFCLIIMVQLWACASPSDSVTQEKNTPQHKGKSLRREDVKEEAEEAEEVEDIGGLEEENPQKTNDGLIDKKQKKGTEIISSKNSGKGNTTGKGVGGANKTNAVQAEDALEELSVISYSNVIEAADDMPVQGQKVKLMIKNNHKQAMWYLMPVSGEKTMPSNGQFYVNPEAVPPFLAKQYGTSDSKLIELIYHGKAQQSFRAFYLEAGGSLLFRNYDLGSYQEGEYVPFWAIKGLEVDNKTSLEEWLPFSVASSPDVVIHNTTESGAAKWVDLGANAVFSEQKIKFVQANGIKKHQIPVGVIR